MDIDLAAIELDFTSHAYNRCRQRGVKRDVIAMILALADRTTHVGDGDVYEFLSHKQIKELRKAGLDASVCKSLECTSIVYNPESGKIVTILKGGHNAHGLKRYRRGQWSHQRRASDTRH